MVSDRRKQLLAGGLLVVLVVVMYRAWVSTSAPPVVATSSGRAAGPATAASRSVPALPPAPDVHLQSLEAERPKPVASERNLFRFKARLPLTRPPAQSGLMPPSSSAPVQTGPPTPAGPPPITLKFIGIVEAPEETRKIAVLSDGRNVFHGHEGDIIEGQFRILRIGAESIEMAYVDGRGRQTIRLTGG